MGRLKYKLEYLLGKVSPSRTWQMLTTGKGLSQWIGAEVRIESNRAIFHWNKDNCSHARYQAMPLSTHVRFDWEDDEGGFSLKIIESELTKDLTLVILDECEDEDYESNRQIWQHQINSLQHALGLPKS